MSNNKQTMKLYTTDQVRKAIELSRDTHQEGRAYMERDEYDYSMDEVVDLLTPIELPSELTALNEHLGWLKEALQRVIDDGESESWVYAYKRAIKNAESLIEKYKNEQQ